MLNRRAWILSALISCFVLLLLNWPLYSALTVRQVDSGRILHAVNLGNGDSFSIRYIHSIHLTPVVEKYHIDENLDIVLDSVTFETYGVGMPSDVEPGQTFTHHDGKFTIGSINRRMRYFDQRIGQVVANHVLIADNREIALGEISQPGTAVRFLAVKESAVQRYGRGFRLWLNKLNLTQWDMTK